MNPVLGKARANCVTDADGRCWPGLTPRPALTCPRLRSIELCRGRMKWWDSLLGMVAAGCLLARTTSAAVQSDGGGLPAADLFQDGLIPRLRIEISSEAMSSLRAKPRTYVPANVREGTRVYTNVSIRLKGGPGSFRPLEDRPAFTVNFGRLNPGQKFHGLRNLHL